MSSITNHRLLVFGLWERFCAPEMVSSHCRDPPTPTRTQFLDFTVLHSCLAHLSWQFQSVHLTFLYEDDTDSKQAKIFSVVKCAFMNQEWTKYSNDEQIQLLTEYHSRHRWNLTLDNANAKNVCHRKSSGQWWMSQVLGGVALKLPVTRRAHKHCDWNLRVP